MIENGMEISCCLTLGSVSYNRKTTRGSPGGAHLVLVALVYKCFPIRKTEQIIVTFVTATFIPRVLTVTQTVFSVEAWF
jgi:hypothetical protein